MNRKVFESSETLYRHAADVLISASVAALQHRGRFIIFLSGGTTPLPLFRRLAAPPLNSQIAWANTVVGWSDERCVPPDHRASNYGEVNRTLLSHVPIPRSQILRLQGEREPEAAARTYETQVRHDLRGHPIDLVLLGLGADGHTASLFPDHSALDEKDAWFVPVENPGVEPSRRITATLPLLKVARRILFLVTGEEKSEAYARVWRGVDSPATRVQAALGTRALWLLDRAAAGLTIGG